MQDSLSASDALTSQLYTPAEVRGFVRIERSGPIMVKGYAKGIRPYPKGKKCYGTLELSDQSLSFAISDHAVPEEDAPVILRGVVVFDTRNHLRLQGELVGGWKPDPTRRTPSITRQRESRLPLHAFVAEESAPGLAFLVTPTAWEDIRANAGGVVKREGHRHDFPSFTDVSAIEGAVRRFATDSEVTGFVIACGGFDRIEDIGRSTSLIQALNDTGRPYYVAMGHAMHVLLIDKYADESFVSPSSFGVSLARAVEEHDAQVQMEVERDELLERVAALEHRQETAAASYEVESRGLRDSAERQAHQQARVISHLRRERLIAFGMLVLIVLAWAATHFW